MRKILFLFGLIPLLGCGQKKAKPSKSAPEKERTTFLDEDIDMIFWECQQDDITYEEYMRRLEASLDSMTKAGEYVLVRGSDRNYDTIIGHVRYKHITDE